MSNLIGIDVNDKRLLKISSELNSANNANTELKLINNKLYNNYNSSLNMVIDISNLLHRYNRVFTVLEKNMRSIENSFKYNDSDLDYIRVQTQNKFNDLISKLNKETDDMINIYESKGMENKATKLLKFKKNYNKIYET
tara:strand:+ start:1158 stop:1574 length:417 start_codon:yes stop_codon:yes gene_type:complete